MSMNDTLLRYLCAAAVIASLAGFPGSVGSEEALQEYRVEILVMRHLNNEARSFEAPQIQEQTIVSDTAVFPPEEERRRVRYRSLRSSDLQLSKARAQLRRSRDFRPLMDIGWTQAALGSERAGWVRVSGAAEDGTVISGEARLAVSRYLHLRLDLEADIPGKGKFRMDESRRMKSGDLHYFDHPEFGALVIIIPEPKPEPLPAPATPGG